MAEQSLTDLGSHPGFLFNSCLGKLPFSLKIGFFNEESVIIIHILQTC